MAQGFRKMADMTYDGFKLASRWVQVAPDRFNYFIFACGLHLCNK